MVSARKLAYWVRWSVGCFLLVPAWCGDVSAMLLIASCPRLERARRPVAACFMTGYIVLFLISCGVQATMDDEAQRRASVDDAMKIVLDMMNKTNGSSETISRLQGNSTFRAISAHVSPRAETKKFEFGLEQRNVFSSLKGLIFAMWVSFHSLTSMLQICLSSWQSWPRLACTCVWAVLLCTLLGD